MKKTIDSFILCKEMSKVCFYIFYVVHVFYGTALYSFLLSISDIANTDEIVNSTVNPSK